MSHRTKLQAGRVCVIAEVGMNHDGSLGNALRLIDVAAECRADAVKFQLHVAEAETLREAPPPPYFSAEPRYDYFQRTAFSLEQWKRLKAHAEARRLEFLCSPFSLEAVELLEQIGLGRYKIPSGEVTNLSLLARVSKTGKPVLLSSGMGTWAELDAAIKAIGHRQITLLQCTSEYPCTYEHVGLNVMREMQARYQLPVGLSDHTLTNYAAFAAVALVAVVIEKHFTLSRRAYGSDAKHSLEPQELADFVRGIRAIEQMQAHPVEKDRLAETLAPMKQVFEKSVVSVVDIPAGTPITQEVVGIKKPGTGIPARDLPRVLGRRTIRPLAKNQVIVEADLEP